MKKSIVILVISFLSATSFAQNSERRNLENKLAIQGFDPVAYFKSDKAVEGKSEIKVEYNGAVYQFSSEENKALFLKNPTMYEPQYGGFCAYGMSKGYEAPIKPEAFTIVDQKLYLNYNLKVKEMWSKDQQQFIKLANSNWETNSK